MELIVDLVDKRSLFANGLSVVWLAHTENCVNKPSIHFLLSGRCAAPRLLLLLGCGVHIPGSISHERRPDCRRNVPNARPKTE